MNIINNFFKSILSDSNEELFLPSEYVPPKGIEGLRVSKTVVPDQKASYTETFNHINQQLTQV